MQEPGMEIEEPKQKVEFNYVTWKKNVFGNYHSAVTHILEWPSLTVRFLPELSYSEDGLFMTQKLLFGTHTNDKEHNYLYLADTVLPDPSKGEEALKAFGEHCKNGEGSVSISKTIAHNGQVLRAEANPINPALVATKSSDGGVYLFKTDECSVKPKGKVTQHFSKLSGHETEGWGLNWRSDGRTLLSADDTGKVLEWDLGKLDQKDSKEAFPCQEFRFHDSPVNDLQYHRQHSRIFAYVADHNLSLWDDRIGYSGPFLNVMAHTREVFSLDFSPFDEFLILTAGADSLIKLWDLRHLGSPLSEFRESEGDISNVSWSPRVEGLFASCGENKRVTLWDCSRLSETGDSSQCMIFSHYGHSGLVNNFDWSPHRDFSLASVDSRNMLQLWEMDSKFYIN